MTATSSATVLPMKGMSRPKARQPKRLPQPTSCTTSSASHWPPTPPPVSKFRHTYGLTGGIMEPVGSTFIPEGVRPLAAVPLEAYGKPLFGAFGSY